MDILADPATASLRDRASLFEAAVLRAAATLRIADHIAPEGTSLDDLVAALDAHRPTLRALLGVLVDMGVLQRLPGKRFRVTELGEPLRSDSSDSVRYHLDRHGVLARSDIAMLFLDHTVRTGKPGFDALGGRTFWEDCSDDDRLAMQPGSFMPQLPMDGDVIVTEYPWASVTRVIDIGGNTGALAEALVAAHPHLHVTVLDLEGIAAEAGRRLARSPHSDRLAAAAGSFFDPLPRGADVYTLSAILGDWDDEDAVRILRRAAEAIAGGGTLLLADAHVPLETSRSELYLRCMMPAPTRTTDRLVELAEQAGLVLTWRGIGTQRRSLLAFHASAQHGVVS